MFHLLSQYRWCNLETVILDIEIFQRGSIWNSLQVRTWQKTLKSLTSSHMNTSQDRTVQNTVKSWTCRPYVIFPGQNSPGRRNHRPEQLARVGSHRRQPVLNPAMHKASDAGHIEPHGMRRCLSFSYRGRRHQPPTRPRRQKNGSFLKSARCA